MYFKLRVLNQLWRGLTEKRHKEARWSVPTYTEAMNVEDHPNRTALANRDEL
jgi:hypothetical protein